MDRRSVIKNAGIAGILAAGAAPAVHAQAAIRWRLASSFPKSLDTIHGAADTFAKAVKAMSGGKFEISVHAAGEIMPAFGVGTVCNKAPLKWLTQPLTTSLVRTKHLLWVVPFLSV